MWFGGVEVKNSGVLEEEKRNTAESFEACCIMIEQVWHLSRELSDTLKAFKVEQVKSPN